MVVVVVVMLVSWCWWGLLLGWCLCLVYVVSVVLLLSRMW